MAAVRRQAISGTKTPLLYLSLQSDQTISFSGSPSLTIQLPSSTTVANTLFNIASYDAAKGWTPGSGVSLASGGSITLSPGTLLPNPLTAKQVWNYIIYGQTASGTVTLSSSSASFLSVANAPNLIIASEGNYNGPFTASSTNCSNIATIAPNSGTGAFTVGPSAAGVCTFTIADLLGNRAVLTVTVTTTTLTGQ